MYSRRNTCTWRSLCVQGTVKVFHECDLLSVFQVWWSGGQWRWRECFCHVYHHRQCHKWVTCPITCMLYWHALHVWVHLLVVSCAAYPDPCLSAGCSHDCIPIGPGMFSCQCPLGSYLDSQDNKTCVANSEYLCTLCIYIYIHTYTGPVKQ